MSQARAFPRLRRTVVRLAIVGCLAVTGALLAAGAASASPRSAQASPLAGKKVVLLNCADAVPWCAAFNKTFKESMTKAGVETTVLTDNFDANVQNQHMNQAIASHPDAILVLASDYKAIIPGVIRAKNAGIPVVNLDAPLADGGSKYLTFQVLADHYRLGVLSAQGLVSGLKKEGLAKANVIVLSGVLAGPTAPLRLAGFKSVFKKYPQYKIVAIQDTFWDQTKATQAAQQLFAQYASKGGIQGVYGMNDLLALGAVHAAQQAGVKVGTKQHGLIVVGGNCLAPGIAAIKDGSEYSSATQSPVPQAKATASHLIAFLRGAKQPKTTLLPEYAITPSNVSR